MVTNPGGLDWLLGEVRRGVEGVTLNKECAGYKGELNSQAAAYMVSISGIRRKWMEGPR